MSFLTDLLSQFVENYGKNTTEDYAQRDKDTAMAREQQLATLQRNVAYTNSPVFQEFWGKTDAGKRYKAQQEAELARLTQLQSQGYPTTTGQDIMQAIGNTISDTASGRPFTRLTKTEGQSKAWDKFQDFGGNAVMGLGTALAPTPKFLSGPKAMPKTMSIVPEEAGFIAKASGAKPIYGAAQKASAKAGATASPAQLKSMTDLQYSVGGDVGSALQTERAVPMRGQTLNQAQKVAQKAPGTLNVIGSDGTVIGTEGKVIKELGEQGGIKYKQVEYTDPTTGKRTTSSVPENLIQDTATKPTTPKVDSKPVPVAQAEVPKTKWQQVKKGVGKAVVPASVGLAAYTMGRNWDPNAGLPAQPAPATPAEPEQSLEQYIAGFDLNKADKLVTPQQTPAQVQEPSFLEKLLQQVLTQGQQSQREGSLTEEQLLQRMESMMNQPQPPPPQVPDNKPKSTLGMVMDALGRGLIAGGTGQADPDAAQKLEMERMTTNQNLAQNARKLTPQQEMTMQMLQSLLSNKMQLGNIQQQGAQSQQNALIQAIVASLLGSQQTGANQQFTAGQNALDRASAEKIANMRAEAETRQMLETLRYYDELQRAKSGQAPSDPKVNF